MLMGLNSSAWGGYFKITGFAADDFLLFRVGLLFKFNRKACAHKSIVKHQISLTIPSAARAFKMAMKAEDNDSPAMAPDATGTVYPSAVLA